MGLSVQRELKVAVVLRQLIEVLLGECEGIGGKLVSDASFALFGPSLPDSGELLKQRPLEKGFAAEKVELQFGIRCRKEEFECSKSDGFGHLASRLLLDGAVAATQLALPGRD